VSDRYTIKSSALLRYFVLTLMIIGLLYDSYRYPLRINSTGTSPTYADTPAWLSAGKYVLIAGVATLFVAGVRLAHKALELYKPFYGLMYVYLCVAPVLYGLLIKSMETVESGFFFAIPTLVHLAAQRKVKATVFSRFFVAAALLAIVTDTLQVTAFLTWGRLPALAFEHSFLVRFGGYWDDPNGFGVFLAFLLPFSTEHWSGSRIRMPVVIGLATCLLLTQSLTAIVAISCALAMLYATRVVKERGIQWSSIGWGTAFCVICAVALCWGWNALADLSGNYVSLRIDSINGHTEPAVAELSQFSWLSLLGLWPVMPMTESGYVNMLGSCGLVYFLVFALVAISATAYYAHCSLNFSQPPRARAFFAGSFCFLIAFCVAEFNLPVDRIFPLNLFCCLLLGLASSRVLGTS
jgi:hypothetical protein